MDVFDGEVATTLVGFEIGSAETVVVMMALGILVLPADEADVAGGKPKMEPLV